MAHVFISYARPDYERARELAVALERAQVQLWWDPKIRIGEQFSPAIENALRSAGAVVVLWSRNAVRSDWVIREATIALQQGVYIPCLLEAVTPPGPFAHFDCANLTGWSPDKPHREFDQLRRRLLGGGQSWSASRLDPNTLHVHLSSENHTVQYSEGHVYVDGELVARGAPSVIDERSFAFELNDGAKRYPARLTVVVTMFRGAVKTLALEIGGTVLYRG